MCLNKTEQTMQIHFCHYCCGRSPKVSCNCYNFSQTDQRDVQSSGTNEHVDEQESGFDCVIATKGQKTTTVTWSELCLCLYKRCSLKDTWIQHDCAAALSVFTYLCLCTLFACQPKGRRSWQVLHNTAEAAWVQMWRGFSFFFFLHHPAEW